MRSTRQTAEEKPSQAPRHQSVYWTTAMTKSIRELALETVSCDPADFVTASYWNDVARYLHQQVATLPAPIDDDSDLPDPIV